MRRPHMFGGLFLALCGAFWTFMFYSFGTMGAAGDPNVAGAARQAAIWREVIRQPMFPLGFIMLFAGIWLMFHEPKRAA